MQKEEEEGEGEIVLGVVGDNGAKALLWLAYWYWLRVNF